MNGLAFIATGLPRSGTTWMANWLTTDYTHCHHDPLYHTHYREWDEKMPVPGRVTGVACTGVWMLRGWLDRHPAKKLIIHRPLEEVNTSLARIGLPPMDRRHAKSLERLPGLHIDHKALFDPQEADRIHFYLTGHHFDPIRHKALLQFHVQPRFRQIHYDRKGAVEIFRDINAEAAA